MSFDGNQNFSQIRYLTAFKTVYLQRLKKN
jgi:hypothetical protein